jgi:hypothetical protein
MKMQHTPQEEEDDEEEEEEEEGPRYIGHVDPSKEDVTTWG